MRLHDYPLSGNGYKVRLLLAHLGTQYDYVPVDILAGEARTESFRRMNPIAKIPVLELDDGRFLSESNAILFFLSKGTRYWPEDAFEQALVMRWLFFEQRNHMPNVAGARFWLAIQKAELTAAQHELVRDMQAKGTDALAVMDQYLAHEEFLVGERYSIADISLYAYTHLAAEGGFDLARFPAVDRWLRRVETQPRHVRIDEWNRQT